MGMVERLTTERIISSKLQRTAVVVWFIIKISEDWVKLALIDCYHAGDSWSEEPGVEAGRALWLAGLVFAKYGVIIA